MTPGWTVFLDRDGVLNRKAAPGDYIKSWMEFAWLPASRPALARLARAGLRLVVVTNQQGVARGLIRPADLAEIHARLRADAAEAGAALDGIYVCPHLAGTCECRKPGIGLFQQAQDEYPDIRFDRSVVVGDAESDMVAGRRVGARTVYVRRPEAPAADADATVEDLGQAADRILSWV